MDARWRAVETALLCVLLGACSMSFDDGQGGRRVIGFVDLRIAPPPEDVPVAGDMVDLRTLGLAVARNAQGGHIAFGYTRDIVFALRDDTAVVRDIDQVCRMAVTHHVPTGGPQ